MSILIKGMEMPKNCNKCPMTVNGYCRIIGYPNGDALSKRYKPLWCPLVEVPKHGRLIDADEAIGKIVHGEYVTMVDKYGNSWMMPGKAIEIIADAPTIIEAEGRENE